MATLSRRLACSILPLASLAALGPGALAQSSGPVTVNTATSSLRCRVYLAGQYGVWVTMPFTSALSMTPPAAQGGALGLTHLHVEFPGGTYFVPIYGVDQTWVTLSSIVIDAAPTTVSLPGAIATGGATSFTGTGISEAAQGTANYAATNFGCSTLAAGGAPCSGPFNLATPGANTSGTVTSGTYTPGSNGAPAAVSLLYAGTFRLATGATWGGVEVQATINGTLGAQQPPTCRPDFNRSGTLTVQDIFDFLAAWFAGNASANFDGVNGVTVQDIFAFLSAWFAGCP